MMRVLQWHLQVGVVCLQGCVALLQRGSLPLQGKNLSLLTVGLTLQLLQLGLHSLALCLQCCILERKEKGGEMTMKKKLLAG